RYALGHLKSEFAVEPGADPTAIRLAYDGARELRVDATGALVIATPTGDLRESAPVAYQLIDGRRVEVPCEFSIAGPFLVQFRLAPYDRSRELIIDPILSSTFLGGSHLEAA